MDEQAKVHHHKSKHRRSGSSRKSDAVDDNTARRPKSPDDDSNVVSGAPNVATSSQKKIVEARENDDPKIVLSEIDVAETVPKEAAEEKGAIQKGILGYMDREIKTLKKPQSLSDPTASPAQRSTRSRSSIEKSPRQKRSKSESRRRRERKLIAAGEMEVRQANETLMRYLKQCSEINDASLSGELEIDKSIDDRRVHRKTKSQRERRGNHAVGIAGGASMSSKSLGTNLMDGNGTSGHGEAIVYMRDRIPPSGLSGILQELAADVVQNHGEIYNPFTPVVSPTDGPPMRTDKMYIQTPRGFRPVSDSLFYKSSMHDDPESHRSSVSASGVSISCIVQRAWILISNICHGLLAGLALAHILFVITTKPVDWVDGSIKHYASFAEVYTNTFYFLAIICMVSIFDRMDICRWNVFTSTESIPFRWIIIVMIYMATIILSLTAESFDDRIYAKNVNISTVQKEMESNRVINMWNPLALARSIGAIVGWALVGMTPTDDLLYHHLAEMDKYHLNNN